MPIVPNAPVPFPTVGSVMNVARARVGDMLDSVDGTLLTNDAPYTQTFLSASWRWYQDRCANNGIELQIKEQVLYGLPMRATMDTANQCFISAQGCSDGVNEYESPALPPLVNPLSLYQRIAGQTSEFRLMRVADDGLPVCLDTEVYDWRENAIWFYGASLARDFRLRFSAYFADLDVTIPSMTVPMRGCEDCLGARVAYEYASARGAAQTDAMRQWADAAFEQTIQRTSRRKQRISIRRLPYGSGGNYGARWPLPY